MLECLRAIFEYVEAPPPRPVAKHVDEFVEWTAEHLLHSLNLYTAQSGFVQSFRADGPGLGNLKRFARVAPKHLWLHKGNLQRQLQIDQHLCFAFHLLIQSCLLGRQHLLKEWQIL